MELIDKFNVSGDKRAVKDHKEAVKKGVTYSTIGMLATGAVGGAVTANEVLAKDIANGNRKPPNKQVIKNPQNADDYFAETYDLRYTTTPPQDNQSSKSEHPEYKKVVDSNGDYSYVLDVGGKKQDEETVKDTTGNIKPNNTTDTPQKEAHEKQGENPDTINHIIKTIEGYLSNLPTTEEVLKFLSSLFSTTNANGTPISLNEITQSLQPSYLSNNENLSVDTVTEKLYDDYLQWTAQHAQEIRRAKEEGSNLPGFSAYVQYLKERGTPLSERQISVLLNKVTDNNWEQTSDQNITDNNDPSLFSPSTTQAGINFSKEMNPAQEAGKPPESIAPQNQNNSSFNSPDNSQVNIILSTENLQKYLKELSLEEIKKIALSILSLLIPKNANAQSLEDAVVPGNPHDINIQNADIGQVRNGARYHTEQPYSLPEDNRFYTPDSNDDSQPTTPGDGLSIGPKDNETQWNINTSGSTPGVRNYSIKSKGNMFNTPKVDPSAKFSAGRVRIK